MLVASTAVEDSDLPPAGIAAAPELASEASLARRQEFENILPQALPRFRRIGQQAISELLVDPSPTPEKRVERFQLSALAIKLARSLAPSHRQLCASIKQNDLSIRKVAKKLGVREGTLKAQVA